MAGLVIPIQEEDKLKIINDTLDGLGDIMGNSFKAQVEKQKQSQELDEIRDQRDNMIAKLQMKGTLSPIQLRYLKLKNKLTTTYHKFFVKHKWLQKTLGYFKSMAQSSKGGLIKFITGLLAMALFDPEGKLLKQMSEFIVSGIKKLVETVRKFMLPLLKTMFILATEIIPVIIKELGLAIWGILKDLFVTGEFSTLIGTIGILLLAIGKFTPLFGILGTVISAIGLPITLIIAGITALYIWAEELSSMFDSIINWFKSLSTTAKVFIGIIALVFLPITAFVGIIFGLVKLFKSIKKIGFMTTINNIWTSIKEFFINIFTKISEFFNNIFKWFNKLGVGFKILGIIIALIILPITAFVGIIYGLYKLFSSFSKIGVVETFKKIWENIIRFFSMISSDITNFINDYFIQPIFNFFKTIFNFYINMFSKILNIYININKIFLGFINNYIIKPVKKFFKGFFTTLKTIGKFLNKWFIDPIIKFFKGIARFMEYIFSPIKLIFKSIFEPLKTIFEPLMKLINPAFKGLFKTVKWIWDLVSNVIVKSFQKIKNFIVGILAWFSGLSQFGLSWITMGGGQREKYTEIYKQAETQNVDLSSLKDLIEKEQRTKADEAKIAKIEKVTGIEIGDEFKDFMKELIAQKRTTAVQAVKKIKSFNLNKTNTLEKI